MRKGLSVPVVAAVLAGIMNWLDVARAVEFRFTAESVGDGRTIWGPNDVVIHKTTDLEDGLWFVLENPTDRTHAFAVYGLFEEVINEHGGAATKPLRVNVTPDDNLHIRASTAQFEGRQNSANEDFEFFCPLHKGKAHLGGTIHVVP